MQMPCGRLPLLSKLALRRCFKKQMFLENWQIEMRKGGYFLKKIPINCKYKESQTT